MNCYDKSQHLPVKISMKFQFMVRLELIWWIISTPKNNINEKFQFMIRIELFRWIGTPHEIISMKSFNLKPTKERQTNKTEEAPKSDKNFLLFQ